MKILIVGAGAIGGLFGGYLERAGLRPMWLVRPARKQQLAQGLTIRLPDESWSVDPWLVTADELTAPVDLVILTNKAFALDGVMTDIAPAVGPATLILPLLNGLAHLDWLDATFGSERVLGGIAKTVATLADAQTVVVNNALSSLSIGARRPLQMAAVEDIRRCFREAGIRLDDDADIMQAMWDKFCRMAALGAANCLLQGHVGDYMRSQAGGEIALRLFAECTAVAAAAGYPLPEESVRGFQRALTNPKSSFSSSMYRDMQQGLPIEGEHLVGDMLSRAADLGLPSPMLDVANALLQTYSARLAQAVAE